MKKTILILGAFALVTFTSCEKKTETTVENDGDIETVETVGVDDYAVDTTATDIEQGFDAAGNAIEEGANDVAEGAENVANDRGDAAHDATDGDGDISK